MPSLIIVESDGKTALYCIRKQLTTVGSDKLCDVRLRSEQVPSVAVHVMKEGSHFIATALSSDAPFAAKIGGKNLSRSKLTNGDVLRAGTSTLTYFESDDDASALLRGISTTQTVQPAGALVDIKATRFQMSADKFADEKNDGSYSDREIAAYTRLLNFSERLASERSVEALLHALIDEVIALVRAESGFLVLIENGSPEVKVHRNLSKAPLQNEKGIFSDSILSKVFSTKTAIVLSDAQHDGDFSSSVSVINFRLSSVMCVPLIYQGELLGALYVGNNSAINAFDQKSLEILKVFSAQASVLVQNALHVNVLSEETKSLRQSLDMAAFGMIIGACPSMQAVFRQIEKVAQADVGALLVGETGTGKEMIARELHRRSPRKNGPFVVVNCGAIPENLLESELFGYVRGAFTGAVQNKAGKFQAASGGFLFLDEIGEMPLHLQVKILRVLQDHQVTRIGETKAEEIDFRIVAATNRNLEAMVRDGTFREDLYYRLNIIQVQIPPLRERGNDVMVMGSYFLKKYAALYHRPIVGLTEGAQNVLLNYAWPGNVRQLENRIRRAVVMCEGSRIAPEDLELGKKAKAELLPLAEAMENFKRRYVSDALERNAGNRTKTARELGVDPRTIFRHLEDVKRDGDMNA
jgi:transcriptional regulator with GAF, ATPase, and Fis domain